MTRSAFITGLQLSVRAASSAGLAVAIAQFFGMPELIYAMIGAVIVMDLSPARTRELALQRVAGTVLGALLGAVVSQMLASNPWVIASSIFAAMLLCQILHLKGAEKVSGYVCGVVLLTHASDPWLYAWLRLVETLIGIGASVLVSCVPKLMRADPAERGGR